MEMVWIVFAVVAGLALLILLIAYVCFRMAFFAPDRAKQEDAFVLPDTPEYAPVRTLMDNWIRKMQQMPCRHMEITSFDGLTLRGRYYEQTPGAPVELMIHGYRSSAGKDMCGGIERAFAVGHNALLIDQRGCGFSDGNVITFGVLESRDCVAWARHMVQEFGPDVQIILTGISMGAATVLMASGREDLPENVVGVLADCGYSSARQIITRVVYGMKLPGKLAYPFVKLGAKLFGKFDLDENPPVEAVKNCRVPVVFFHGAEDTFVPPEMSQENFDACPTRKALHIIPGAGHGLSFPTEQTEYVRLAKEFFHPEERP